MVKIKDIAKETGYSITTVSKAFNDYKDISKEAKEIILATAERMGYVPNATARGLVTKKSYMIGVIFDEILGFGIRHPFFGAVIEYFKEAMEKEGYDLLFISNRIGKGPIKTYIDHCKQRGVDGIFIACANFDSEMIQQLIDSNIPSVSVETSHAKVNSINSDDYYGAYSAVEYLYELGHRRIAHIAGSDTTYAGKARKQGYMAAMTELGIMTDEIAWTYVVNDDMYTFDGGYKAMKQLLNLKNPPTAVTTAGDMLALGAAKYLREVNLEMPKDMSIIGFDNIDLLEFIDPSLTTVGQNFSMLGKRAAELLLENINNPDMNKREVYISTKLVKRKSCQKI